MLQFEGFQLHQHWIFHDNHIPPAYCSLFSSRNFIWKSSYYLMWWNMCVLKCRHFGKTGVSYHKFIHHTFWTLHMLENVFCECYYVFYESWRRGFCEDLQTKVKGLPTLRMRYKVIFSLLACFQIFTYRMLSKLHEVKIQAFFFGEDLTKNNWNQRIYF